MEKSLIIQNNSGINTIIRLDVRNFKTVEKKDNSDPLIRDPMKVPSELADRYKLKNNQLGLGFVINKPEFFLPAFGLVKVTLAALSEIWGLYDDYLLVNAEGKKQTDSIHMEINVVNNPIRLFTTKVIDNEEEIAMLRCVINSCEFRPTTLVFKKICF